ncbi:hypothetical protein HZB01_03640 [Candidatus Woesearchaeota archaeon]|nr:hypothetical protein [Candidatus Woesearchaeota archaeon]
MGEARYPGTSLSTSERTMTPLAGMLSFLNRTRDPATLNPSTNPGLVQHFTFPGGSYMSGYGAGAGRYEGGMTATPAHPYNHSTTTLDAMLPSRSAPYSNQTGASSAWFGNMEQYRKNYDAEKGAEKKQAAKGAGKEKLEDLETRIPDATQDSPLKSHTSEFPAHDSLDLRTVYGLGKNDDVVFEAKGKGYNASVTAGYLPSVGNYLAVTMRDEAGNVKSNYAVVFNVPTSESKEQKSRYAHLIETEVFAAIDKIAGGGNYALAGLEQIARVPIKLGAQNVALLAKGEQARKLQDADALRPQPF